MTPPEIQCEEIIKTMTNQVTNGESGAQLNRGDATSTSLIRRLKTRDEEAWQRLLDLYVPLVYSWCRRSDMQAEDAADVVQEVFQAVFRGIVGFRHDRPGDTFRGWLRTIARNKIRDHFGRRTGQPTACGGTDANQRLMEVAEEEEISAQPGPLGLLCHRALESIRAEFEDRTWQAFWFVTIDQRSSTDVARQLGMSSSSVRQAKCRVLRRLRQEMGDVE